MCRSRRAGRGTGGGDGLEIRERPGRQPWPPQPQAPIMPFMGAPPNVAAALRGLAGGGAAGAVAADRQRRLIAAGPPVAGDAPGRPFSLFATVREVTNSELPSTARCCGRRRARRGRGRRAVRPPKGVTPASNPPPRRLARRPAARSGLPLDRRSVWSGPSGLCTCDLGHQLDGWWTHRPPVGRREQVGGPELVVETHPRVSSSARRQRAAGHRRPNLPLRSLSRFSPAACSGAVCPSCNCRGLDRR